MIKNRILWIDYVKALAIIGVIGIHCSSLLLDNRYLFLCSWYESVFASSFFRFGIVLFIMASGFLLLRKPQPLSKIPHRLKRILLPFVFWLVVYAVVKVVFRNALGSQWNVTDLLSYILTGFLDPLNISIQFWYVYMILGLYLLSPILSRWIEHAGTCEIEYFLILWMSVSLAQFCCIESVLLDYLRYFSGALGYFVLGYYLTLNKHKILSDKRFGAVLFILGFLFTLTGTILFSHMQQSQSLFFIRLGDITPGTFMEATGLYIILCNTDFNGLNRKINTFVTGISRDSYGIYLVNILVINLLEKLGIISTDEHTLLMIIVSVIIVLTLSKIIIEVLYRFRPTRIIAARG